METTQVKIGPTTWTVNLDGERLMIVDDLGRMRHKSKGHLFTGVYLAMALADKPFESDPAVDDALIATAKDFQSPPET